MSLTGWVKDQDGKTVFINDKDKQAWSIANMDAVKGHEGHHVQIKAKLNETDHSVNLRSCQCCARASRLAKNRSRRKEVTSSNQASRARWRSQPARSFFCATVNGYALGVRTSMPAADQKLIQIVDAALAETARKSGEWLVCRKGCTHAATEYSPSASWMQCACAKALLNLQAADPRRAAQVRNGVQAVGGAACAGFFRQCQVRHSG